MSEQQRERQMARVLAGVDASRRVGWARYYETEEAAAQQRDALVRSCIAWMAEAVAIALMVRHHERLAFDDPLVADAEDLINRIGSTPTGHDIVEAVTEAVLRDRRQR